MMHEMLPELKWALEQDTAFLQLVSDISCLPTVLWAKDLLWISKDTTEHPCQANPALCSRLETGCLPGKPNIYMENEYVFWGVMQIGRYHIAIGPAVGNRSGKDHEKDYATIHGMPHVQSLPYVPFGDMSKYLSLLSSHFFGTVIRYDEIEMRGIGSEHMLWESEGDLEQYQLSQSEYDRGHGSGMSYEEDMMTAVREGDVERVKQLIGGVTPNMGEVGQVTPESHKQIEYMIVSMLTLLTRAAVEGGLHPEAAHELGDIYLNRLAVASTNGGSYATLGFRAMVEFAEQVRRAKVTQSHSPHVEACKIYVEQNLRKNIKVADVAPALGVSRTYLSHLFQKEEGLSLQLYIQREKCRHAERLLKFSDYPISLISEYFGFSSPSYFGTCFQRWYGTSPAQYRRDNVKI